MDVCGFILIICLSSSVSVCDTKDEETLCVYMKSCVLPCRFTPGSDLYIQWTKTERDLIVHSFHHDPNQVLVQYLDYRGRTSLFEEEKNTGNASLQLRDVTVEDEGRYLCLANGQVTYVNMKVFAPVLQVHIDVRDGNLICHAQDIYPEPSLKWTMNPEAQVSVNRSETGLFCVNSSIPLWRITLHKYTCTVSTEHSTNNNTYERKEWAYVFWILPLICTSLVAIIVCFCKKRNRFQVISSKFHKKWKEKTGAPGKITSSLSGPDSCYSDPRADTVTDADAGVDVPNPEEEHLEPNISEEAESEL